MSGKKLAVFFGILILVLGIVKIVSIAEMTPPVISVEQDISNLGKKPFDVKVSDEGTGLSEVRIYLLDTYGESTLAEKKYAKGTKSDVLTVSIDPVKLGIKSGESELFVEAADRFMEGILPARRSVFSRKVTLDFAPPEIEELSPMQYVRHGGSGVVAYRVSADAVSSGVQIGDVFFRGYGGHFEDPEIHLAFFAYPYSAGWDEKIEILASDQAGNEVRRSVGYRLLRASYSKDTIPVSGEFLRRKVLPLFQRGSGPEQGEPELLEAFLKINNEMRGENDGRIYEVGRRSADRILWVGKFDQLPNSKAEATFAEHRSYVMGGRVVDAQYHLGYDLSVSRRYPVTASNSGVVVFADDLGIYGNTVIIDHGMGLMTLYSHMSSIDAAVGDEVKKGDRIGRTGTTGLALGDHLHFGVYVHGIAVRPLEWWDEKWIKDNIWRKVGFVRKNLENKVIPR